MRVIYAKVMERAFQPIAITEFPTAKNAYERFLLYRFNAEKREP